MAITLSAVSDPEVGSLPLIRQNSVSSHKKEFFFGSTTRNNSKIGFGSGSRRVGTVWFDSIRTVSKKFVLGPDPAGTERYHMV
jgi:hypothetical protein